jgi:alpha-glucosidase
MKSLPYLFLCVIILIGSGCTARNLHLSSPDGKLGFTIKPGGNGRDNSIASFSMKAGQRQILLPSSLFIKTDRSEPVGEINVIRIETDKFSETWTNNFGEKKTVPDEYNELKIYLSSNKGRINLICRAYNEGIAIAYEIPEQEGKDSVLISDENIIFRFPSDYYAWSAPRAQAQYRKVPLSRIDKGCERPLVIEPDSTLTIALGEAGLIDYPRMKFDPDSTGGISIRSRLDGNVRRRVPFRSPWRFIMTGKCPGDLIERNYFVLNLNDPSRINDVSWIRPGKVLREVTLTTGGGKAAVDFTSSHNMQYVEFDAGWYGPENKDESEEL